MCRLKDTELTVESCCTEVENEVLDYEDEVNKTSSYKFPDGGYGYVIVLGAFISYFIADGWAYSFGVVFTELLSHFHESHGKTAIIGALIYAVPLTLSPLVCALCNLYGCRAVGIFGGIICSVAFVTSSFAKSVEQLTLTLGIFASIGLSMIYLSAVLSVTYYFDKKRGLAIGLAVTGSGLGAFAFPPSVEWFVDKYSWRGALFLTGGIFLHVIVSSALFRPVSKSITASDSKHNGPISDNMEDKCSNEKEIDTNSSYNNFKTVTYHKATSSISNNDHKCKSQSIQNCYKSKKSASKENMLTQFCDELKDVKNTILNEKIFTNISFLVFCSSTFITYLWIGTVYVYLVDKAIIMDITYKNAAFLLSIIGIGRTIGQIILGCLGDQKYLNIILLYAFSIAMCGLSNLLIPVCVKYVSLCAICIVFGLFVSSTYTLQIMCLVDMMGLEVGTSAFGFLQLIEGLATFLGTPLTGWLYDELQDYSLPFYISGSMLIFSSIMLLPVFVKIRTSKLKNESL